MTDWYSGDDRFEPTYEEDPDDAERVITKGERREAIREKRVRMGPTQGRSVFLHQQLAARPKRRRRARFA